MWAIQSSFIFLFCVERSANSTHNEEASNVGLPQHKALTLLNHLLQIRLKKLEDAFVFVGPAAGFGEGVVFDGINGQFPVFFF